MPGIWKYSRSAGIIFFNTLCCLSALLVHAQQPAGDSTKYLSEVTVQAFGQKNNLTTAAVATVNEQAASDKTSLVSSFNTIPGARMEERSPGSYRINIRGSSLRSPFGVRNVKIYWNDIPLTDPGGNTYFNQLAFNNFSSIEVIKGPVSSMYGAGTGGLLLVKNDVEEQTGAALEYITGSYGLQSLLASAHLKQERAGSKITYAHNQGRGYREQSAIRRDNVSWTGYLKPAPHQQLSASLLFTDMYYQTPGALTLQEYQNNPKAARPASGIFPSATAAKAAIFQKNFTAGIHYENEFTPVFSNSTTLYGSYNRIENSAIRNYETRNEPHFGGRTVFTINKKWENGNLLTWHTGLEGQTGNFNVRVNGNKNGAPDTLQTNDDVKSVLYSAFTQATFAVEDRWFYTAGVSYNKSRLGFTRLSDEPVLQQPFAFSNEVAPRFSVSKKWTHDFFVLASAAKGYSPPTIAELLPSTGIINTALEAEKGWNYEITLKKYLLHKINIEATGFYFNLNNALVQRRDDAGADYFTNAGNVKQKGMELSADYRFYPRWLKCIQSGYVSAGYTYSHFRYGNFVSESGDFSGNAIPGVPGSMVSLVAAIYGRKGVYGRVTYYGASKIFLNDAHTATTEPYHLLGAKMGYKTTIKKVELNFYAGADNLLNERYSLGNDINAVAGRYYNAAPRRNYYAGAAIGYNKQER